MIWINSSAQNAKIRQLVFAGSDMQTREHVTYVYTTDARLEGAEEIYTYPGEGHGRIPAILHFPMEDGYDGGISIKPHMASVFHNPDAASASEEESVEI